MSEGDEKRRLVRYHHIKSNHFRVILAEGAFGGPSTRGLLRIAFFNERVPLPQVTAHSVSVTGEIGAEERALRVTRDGIVREVETEIVMTLEAAVSFRTWLDEQIIGLSAIRATETVASDTGAPIAIGGAKT